MAITAAKRTDEGPSWVAASAMDENDVGGNLKAKIQPRRPGETIKVAETVLRRRDRNLKAQAKRAEQIQQQKKKAKHTKGKLRIIKAEKLIKDARQRPFLRTQSFVLSASLCASHTCSAMALRALALVALFQGATALELTESNWDAETAGKSVFVKFLDWDKLMDEFNGSPGSLVADVDCTAEGQSLCTKFEIKAVWGRFTGSLQFQGV
ncbi:Protein disulfide-isomerase-like protein EhSep2 [Symbiodinium microadriaticum]|uniref:Protein disulfide-isomerase-like protein EhSep2 n=1 Tax=Symbiodinium microadriaticum TaxID=2951 RepID=A0A1Q9CTI2_SYMMI|nr:Protein disulfide-isomerase-like protein EhSep2 [Symbiodinium microadriaticum]